MVNAIVNGIFKLIINLFNAITSPIIGAVTALFPSVSVFFSYINTFLGYALRYVGLVLDLFFIPRAVIWNSPLIINTYRYRYRISIV